MMAELIRQYDLLGAEHLETPYQRTLFPQPAANVEKTLSIAKVTKGGRSVRFPRIHSTEPFIFHFSNVSPCTNHDAVPA
jgi:hypothetical protein